MTGSLFDLSGRTALVTGGASGIGREIVQTLAAHNATVVSCDLTVLDEGWLPAARSHSIWGLHCDVADPDQVTRLADRIPSQLRNIDILVNCAGAGGNNVPFGKLSLADWDRVMNVNLRGVFLVTREFHQGMIDRRWGRIINISSQLAYKGGPELAHYCASKAGVVGFTRALSLESAPHNVLVNTIAPGPVETDLLFNHSQDWLDRKKSELPVGRFGTAPEIAATALLLASDAGSFYSGQTLSPNGGDIPL